MGTHETAPVSGATVQSYPAVGEVFELTTLDGDANQPLEMVKRDGYSGEWKHEGPTIRGRTQARCFKLVQVGPCRDLNEVREKLAAHGTIPEGQWREAFKAAYPKADGKGPIGFADPSWVNPRGDAYFPCVYSVGDSSFYGADSDFYERWRWLVAVG